MKRFMVVVIVGDRRVVMCVAVRKEKQAAALMFSKKTGVVSLRALSSSSCQADGETLGEVNNSPPVVLIFCMGTPVLLQTLI